MASQRCRQAIPNPSVVACQKFTMTNLGYNGHQALARVGIVCCNPDIVRKGMLVSQANFLFWFHLIACSAYCFPSIAVVHMYLD